MRSLPGEESNAAGNGGMPAMMPMFNRSFKGLSGTGQFEPLGGESLEQRPNSLFKPLDTS